ncbi:hypothetical protein K501DRAFT_335149 [Backusella circina FSU 941]|nr:hypothetical protein K501DRAFT_335149 [Backusella circina FSU 941]
MTAEYCVDYLSYKWTSPDDLVQTFIETRKQYRSIIDDDHSSLSAKEMKRAETENYKLKRFQNALWREMARSCTNKLSKQNRLIDPASVSWQKESDITWLFGPMYTSSSKKCNQSSYCTPSMASPQGLKPVLKKRNVTLPALSDSNNKNATAPRISYSQPLYSKSNTKSGNPTTKNKQLHKVRFNPEIIEIQYQPHHPISSSEYQDYNDFDFDDDDYEMDDIDEIWASIVNATLTLKSDTISKIKSFMNYLPTTSTSSPKKKMPSNLKLLHHRTDASFQIAILLLSMAKSVFSLTTTWILYQSLAPFSWFVKPMFQPKHTAGQYKHRLL